MKALRQVLVLALLAYLVVVALNRFAPEGWKEEPIFAALVQARTATNQLTATELRRVLEGKQWTHNGCPYLASVQGGDHGWTITFRPKTPSFCTRVFRALFYWELSPDLPPTYEMDSTSKTITVVSSDGTSSVWGRGGQALISD